MKTNSGSIQTLSKEEFIAAADEINERKATYNAMTASSTSPENDENQGEDDDDGDELVTNAEEREIAVMLGLDAKPKSLE